MGALEYRKLFRALSSMFLFIALLGGYFLVYSALRYEFLGLNLKECI